MIVVYSEETEKICSYCYYMSPAKGLSEHIYCEKRKEYRGIRATACSDYDYDIRKRPVKRRRNPLLDKKYDFEI